MRKYILHIYSIIITLICLFLLFGGKDKEVIWIPKYVFKHKDSIIVKQRDSIITKYKYINKILEDTIKLDGNSNPTRNKNLENIIKDLVEVKNTESLNENDKFKITTFIKHSGDIFDINQDVILKEREIEIKSKGRNKRSFLSEVYLGVGYIKHANSNDIVALGSFKLNKNTNVSLLYNKDYIGGGLTFKLYGK